MKTGLYLKKTVFLFSFTAFSLFFTNCTKDESPELEDSLHNLSACIGDEFGNCDDRTILFDDNPGGGGTGTPASLPSRFQYFHRGNNGDNIFTSYSSSGRGGWSGSFGTNSNNRLDDQSIDAVQFGNRIALVHQGRTTDNIFYSFSRDGRNFTTDRSIPTGARTTGTIKTVEFNNRLFVYHYNGSSGRIYYNNTADGTSWVGNRAISDTKSYGAFDFISFQNRLFLIGRSGTRYYISSSTDGVNFSEVHRTNGEQFGISAHNISITEVNGTFYLLAELGAQAPKGLAIGRWIPNASNPAATSGSRFVDFSPIHHNGGFLRTDQPASIASDGNTLVVVFENNIGRGISFAYTTNFQNTSIYQPISGWTISGASGQTRFSGISLIRTE